MRDELPLGAHFATLPRLGETLQVSQLVWREAQFQIDGVYLYP